MINISVNARNAGKILLYVSPLAWLMAILVVFNVTSPLQTGPAGILGVFGLMYLFASSLLFVATSLTLRLVRLFNRSIRVADKQIYYLVSVIALAPIFILALSTLGQLDVKDVALVLLLVGVGCFYVVRRNTQQAPKF